MLHNGDGTIQSYQCLYRPGYRPDNQIILRYRTETKDFPFPVPSRFITAFTRDDLSPLYLTIKTISMPSHRIYLRSILILSLSTPRPSKWYLSFRFTYKNPYEFLLSHVRATCTAYRDSWIDHPNNIGRRLQITKISFIQIC